MKSFGLILLFLILISVFALFQILFWQFKVKFPQSVEVPLRRQSDRDSSLGLLWEKDRPVNNTNVVNPWQTTTTDNPTIHGHHDFDETFNETQSPEANANIPTPTITTTSTTTTTITTTTTTTATTPKPISTKPPLLIRAAALKLEADKSDLDLRTQLINVTTWMQVATSTELSHSNQSQSTNDLLPEVEFDDDDSNDDGRFQSPDSNYRSSNTPYTEIRHHYHRLVYTEKPMNTDSSVTEVSDDWLKHEQSPQSLFSSPTPFIADLNTEEEKVDDQDYENHFFRTELNAGDDNDDDDKMSSPTQEAPASDPDDHASFPTSTNGPVALKAPRIELGEPIQFKLEDALLIQYSSVKERSKRAGGKHLRIGPLTIERLIYLKDERKKMNHVRQHDDSSNVNRKQVSQNQLLELSSSDARASKVAFQMPIRIIRFEEKDASGASIANLFRNKFMQSNKAIRIHNYPHHRSS